MVLAAAAVVVAAWAGVCALLWLGQDKLLFYPSPVVGARTAPPGWRLEPVRLPVAEGVALEGLLVLPPTPAPHALVIYLGGNAEEVTAYAGEAAAWGDRALLLVNYRGYGASGGRPGEAALVADAAQLFDWAARRPDIDPEAIAVHGRSMGTGVAVQLAAQRPVACVVLTSPFTSARDVAASAYPWAPVRWLLRHPFDSAAHAPGIRRPVLILYGERDTLVPPSQSQSLAQRWGGPVETLALPAGHDDIGLDPRHGEAVRAFLSRHGSNRRPSGA